MMKYAVIMAGGAGTRFWPKSKIAKPKQFLKLFGDQTMLQKTIRRLDGFINPEQVLVITNDDYRAHVFEQVPDLNKSFVIGEKVGRNTAPCVGSAAALLYKKDPDAVMVVLPADHEITDKEEFIRILDAAAQSAEKDNALVTIGIEPDRPETGYGYIHRSQKGKSQYLNKSVFDVRSFAEKPDLEKAKSFLASGDYLWNSGIFIWKVSAIVDAFKKYLPEVYDNMETLMESSCEKDDIDLFYTGCPSISIDYGIMEKADNVKVVPGSFGWNDVGSWKAVHELSNKDQDENANEGAKALFHKSSSSLVHSESGKLITLVGVQNLAVVETEDSILVIDLDHAQEVKEVYDKIEKDPELREYL
ncbi:MAG: mannose-1-phosphate guanylyltransferase [Balneolaceae bacterium]